MSISKAEQIRGKARELGFELVGIAPAIPAPDFDFFRWWLDRGYAGTMDYLRRGIEKRSDPQKILPGVKSVICCGLNYYSGNKSPRGGISNYAWGDDYHEVVGEKLKRLEEFIKGEVDPEALTKSYVDTGPMLERSYAARAGLGWIGKNTMLINNGVGSFVFLGEILTTIEFDKDEYDRPGLDQCGSCTKCLEACPTDALVEPGVLDSNRCISYLTIEYRGDFSPEQEKMVAGHLYGCDICQEVCPYNERISVTPLREFQPRRDLLSGPFSKIIDKSAMSRIKFQQWRRNVKAAIP